MKKTLSVLLMLCLLLGAMPAAYAEGKTPEVIDGGEISLIPEEDLLPEDGQEILDAYAELTMYPEYAFQLFSAGEDRLTDERSLALYNAIKEQIGKVAAGEASSLVTLTWDYTKSPLKWTYGEMGLTAANSDSDVNSVLQQKLRMNEIHGYLLMDLPYDFYWYDKTAGMIGTIKYVRTDTSVIVTEMKLAFAVSEQFRSGTPVDRLVTGSGSAMDCYIVNAAQLLAAKQARTRALEIVEANKDKNDYEKLLAYKDEICRLTDYDHDAVSLTPDRYGAPWQLISVFDGNPETKVVCEGYAKAFQYLCDLSEFEDEETLCYTATGVMGINSPVPHMWNIVTLEGGNYLVDVTNSDQDAIGEEGGLFLAGSANSTGNGYLFQVLGYQVSFEYDDDTRELLPDVLSLSASSYVPNTEPT